VAELGLKRLVEGQVNIYPDATRVRILTTEIPSVPHN